MKNEIIPQYDVRKSEYTIQEKMLLGEMRENLVDVNQPAKTFRFQKRDYYLTSRTYYS